ncbi:GTPase HflX [Enterococcus faecium]|nr:GTPase HflX [Enterococcus faecium]EMF0345868.1 50S ribosome-binding GTPase [Enterococcus faecium]
MEEKVIIVGVETEANQRYFSESMEELVQLTNTASGEVVFTITQKRPQVDRQTIIGKGKLQELVQQADAHEADLIIFNHELTPRQSQLITDAVGLPVIDRVQLILDIFAMRARSKEGKLQVELAQLEYLLPRLVGQGKTLSRLGGGIGTRGPGETKLDPLTKRWRFAEGFEITVTDTVGFIQDLPTQLIDAFHSTLEESQNMDLLLHVVDASSPDRVLQEQTVLKLMDELNMKEMPILTVYNKADQIDPAMFTPTLFPNVLISTQTKEGKMALIEAIKRQLMELMTPYTLSVPSNEGQKLSELRRQTMVLDEAYMEETNEYEVKGFAKTNSKWLRKNQ